MKKIIIGNDKIQVGDFIIDVEKIGVSINGESLGVVVKCKQLLNDDDLIWESLDGKSSACDSIYQFKKVLNNIQVEPEWKDINIEQPNTGDDIIGLTSVGQMKGSYINGDIFRTTGRNGSLYSLSI